MNLSLSRRLREPSTYAGAAALLSVLPLLMANPRDGNAWGALIGGILAVVLPERAEAK